MEFRKNDLLTVTIEDMGHDGEGIGRYQGYTVFVKDAVIGDTVRVKLMKTRKNYGYGRLMEVLEPSPDRVEPPCPISRPCGGYQLQALSYEKQLEYKEGKIRNNLKRIGGFSDEEIPMDPVIGMEHPLGYRNKAQFPVGTDREGRLVTGFYAGRTHSIIPNRKCLLGVPVNEEVLDVVLDFMEEFGVTAYQEDTGRGLVRHVLIRCGFATGEVMVCLVVNGKKIPHQEELVRRLCGIKGMTSIALNVNRDRTNVILGKEIRVLWGQGYITDTIGSIRYQISPLSFFQVNPVQTEKLYGKALEFAGLTGGETVWDLYCGIGTISMFLAQKAGTVYGVEIVPEAIEDARKNAGINGIENAEFFVGRAEEVLPEKYAEEGIRADVIVVDPPRKGCEESVLDTMVKMGPDRIVYVSCDSATLARDLKYLRERGYQLEKVQGVDMFPESVHVETVVLLGRELGKSHEHVYLDYKPSKENYLSGGETYSEIKQWIQAEYGLKVSSLYIAQIKQKHGIIERECHNKSKNTKPPQCPPEKAAAIETALKHFKMI